MIEIVNHVRCDTQNAKNIITTYRASPVIMETLYQKPDGQYFLYGMGDRDSKYAKHSKDGSFTAGEKIFIMTVTRAKNWVYENVSAEKYIAIFGIHPNDDSEINYRIEPDVLSKLSPEQKNKLNDLSRAYGETVPEIIRKWLS